MSNLLKAFFFRAALPTTMPKGYAMDDFGYVFKTKAVKA